MTPYYKLPPNWEKNHSHILLIGPEGLVQYNLFKKIQNAFPKHAIKRISLLEKQDIEQFKTQTLSASLFEEPEILFVRITDKLLPAFPWKISKSPIRQIIVYGTDKLPKSLKDHNAFDIQIRLYNLKEPFLSREINSLLKHHQVTLSTRGAKWLALSHFGCEHLIIPTIERLSLAYGKSSIPDQDLKACIYHQSESNSFDIIDAIQKDKTSLYLQLKSLKKDDWNRTYWALVSHMRKTLLIAKDPTTLKSHFPWESQQKPVIALIKSLGLNKLSQFHKQLLDIEPHLKGLGSEPSHLLIMHWCLKLQESILS